MNGRTKNNGHEEIKAMLEKLESAVAVHDELLTIAKGAEGAMQKLFNKELHLLREGIWESFENLIDACGGEVLADEIGASVKKQMEAGLEGGISGIKAFYLTLKKHIESSAEGGEFNFADISEEVISLLAIEETKTGIAENSPFLKALIKRNSEKQTKAETAATLFTKNDFTIKEGGLTQFQKAVFDVVARAYREGRVTSDNIIVFSKGQAGRWFTGRKGTPSEQQSADFLEALLQMREQPLNYTTTAQLADIVGLEAASLAENIPGLKRTSADLEVNEHILDKVDVVKNRYQQRGQKADIYFIKPGNIALKLLDAMPWYESFPESHQQIRYEKEGRLVNMAYSKKRKALTSFVFDEVFSKIRANAASGGARYYPEKLPYDKIFEACELDVSHGTERANRITDIKRVFEHLQREGEVLSFKEYDRRGKKAAGIQYTIGKFALVDETESGGE